MLESLEKINLEFSPTHEMLNLIAEIDEFKGKWTVEFGILIGDQSRFWGIGQNLCAPHQFPFEN